MTSRTSVVVVAHGNYLQYLKTALESLRRAAATEILVVNNGADTGIFECCRALGVRSLNIASRPLGAAANYGIQAASGRYIVRVDADDWIEPGMLEIEAGYLDDHPEVDCVWCDVLEAVARPGTDWAEVFEITPKPQPVLDLACGAMYRRDCWTALGGYSESLRFAENTDFWLRFQRRFNTQRLQLPMYYYRQHPGSMHTDPEAERVRAEVRRKDFVKHGPS